MKYFDKDGRYNFVDDNNRFIGFSNSQSCCESFGWMLSREVPTNDQIENQEHNGIDADKMQFDPEFFHDSADGEYAGGVTFKLVDGEDVAYLTLFNHHSGYYGHGFEFKDGDKAIQDGSL